MNNIDIGVETEYLQEKIKNPHLNIFGDDFHKFYYLASYFRFYPDRFLDLTSPKDTKYKLNLYQRVMLRMMFRFKNNYIVLSRGSGKTFIELLALILQAIMYPNIKLSVSAESQEQASGILKDKLAELQTWFPVISAEIVKVNFGRDVAEIRFAGNSCIDVLGVKQTSKGLRRNRGSIEESVRINPFLLDDVVIPIFNIPRRTASGDIDKKELHGAMNFMTTSGLTKIVPCISNGIWKNLVNL